MQPAARHATRKATRTPVLGCDTCCSTPKWSTRARTVIAKAYAVAKKMASLEESKDVRHANELPSKSAPLMC